MLFCAVLNSNQVNQSPALGLLIVVFVLIPGNTTSEGSEKEGTEVTTKPAETPPDAAV